MNESSETDLTPTVRERAYYLWVEAGRPAGREHEFWAAAAHELEADRNAEVEQQNSERIVAR
jgi:hypothetical protein